MTDFERLLLAKGDAQLLSAFVKGYYEIISEDFKVSFDKYLAEVREQSGAKCKTSLSDLEKVGQDIKLKDMSISELLKYHDGDKKLKTQMLNALSKDFIQLENYWLLIKEMFISGRKSELSQFPFWWNV